MSPSSEYNLYTAIGDELMDSPARVNEPETTPLRISLIQASWEGSKEAQIQSLTRAVEIASEFEPDLIVFQELTLYPYACSVPNFEGSDFKPEGLISGASHEFATRMAKLSNAHILISLYEEADEEGQLGFNTALLVSPKGDVVTRTRKTHLPESAGYYEDTYFSPGDDGAPTALIGEATVGAPTCWDQWFPELARIYALHESDVLVYPTAIGSEVNHPNFDTQPLWQSVMVGNAIANGIFIAAANRVGTEGDNTFYGSSFIVDPYGRIVLQAGRSEHAVLVADLDLDQRTDWLTLFPFFKTRRPHMYGELVADIELAVEEIQ